MNRSFKGREEGGRAFQVWHCWRSGIWEARGTPSSTYRGQHRVGRDSGGNRARKAGGDRAWLSGDFPDSGHVSSWSRFGVPKHPLRYKGLPKS